MEKIKYFISYYHTGTDTLGEGFGNCYIERENPITDGEDIIALQEMLVKVKKLKDVIIINWKPFEALH